jgi:ribonuclease BN (tRNA processing enzyme)
MRSLRVLGSCGARPEAGRACAGFLLTYDGFTVLLDLGYAALPRLLRYLPDGSVDAVIVTHRHPDHCVDVSGLARVRQDLARDAAPLPLYCEPGVVDVLRALEPRPDPATVFDVHDLVPGEVGPFRLDTARTPHHVPNFGVRLTAPGLSVAYTGDSGPLTRADDAGALVGLARDVDLFVADATLQGPRPAASQSLVMTATEAGGWAARSGARRLLLTHFWPGSDRSVSVAEARVAYDGEVIAADEDLLVPL